MYTPAIVVYLVYHFVNHVVILYRPDMINSIIRLFSTNAKKPRDTFYGQTPGIGILL